MSNMQRSKGAAGERELARLLSDQLGEHVTRNLTQCRDGGADLGGTPFSLEVKRAARPRLTEWWAQACKQAESTGQTPVLAYRIDRLGWNFRLPLGTLHPGFDERDTRLTATIGLVEFAAVVREQWNS